MEKNKIFAYRGVEVPVLERKMIEPATLDQLPEFILEDQQTNKGIKPALRSWTPKFAVIVDPSCFLTTSSIKDLMGLLSSLKEKKWKIKTLVSSSFYDDLKHIEDGKNFSLDSFQRIYYIHKYAFYHYPN